jgi:hypothetical protein
MKAAGRLPEQVVGEGDCDHGFGHGNESRQQAWIVPAFRDDRRR